MGNLNIMRIFLCMAMPVLVYLSSCTTKDHEFSDFDKATIIEHGVHHIFETVHFTSDFYLNPIQMIKSDDVPQSVKMQINGRTCELIDELSKEYYQEDKKHPIPFVKIARLERINDQMVRLDVEFPSIDSIYYLRIRHQAGTIPEVVALNSNPE